MSVEVLSALYPLSFIEEDEQTYAENEHEEIDVLELLLFYDYYVGMIEKGCHYGILENGERTYKVMRPRAWDEIDFLLPFFFDRIMWC